MGEGVMQAGEGNGDGGWSIEWVFAVDSDDPASRSFLLERLRGEQHVVLVTVEAASSFHGEATCVAAWSSCVF